MGTLRLAALIAGEWACGLALLSFAGSATLRCMNRWEKLGAALLLGMAAPSFAALLGLFVGARLSGWWWAAASAASITVLAMRPDRCRALWHDPPAPSAALLPAPLRIFTGVVILTLMLWVIPAALFLPTLDYDGLATWSYRVRVLLAERHLYVEALQDPVRLVPMRQHPYLLPVMEAAHSLARGRFSFAATHVPHVLAWLAFLMLSMAAVRREQRSGRAARAMILFGALVLMPAAAVQVSMESVREVMIGFYGLGAVYFLARWAESPRWTFLLCAAALGMTAQQIKVEGVPFVLGLGLGAALLTAEPGIRMRRLRLLQFTSALALAAVIATPWWIVLNRIPDATVHGYDFSADLNASLFDRLRAVPPVIRLFLSELFARPELYGLSTFAALAGLGYGWRKRNAMARLAMMAAPAACLAALLAIYVGRNDRLPPERNVTFSRRMMCVVPALTLAALHLPRTRRRSAR